ncbi:MAG: hypothetical protein EB075_11500, partial [Bacteroidetes bacterium]|nr:hypothetical protein [Bacteroidota bacterium]
MPRAFQFAARKAIYIPAGRSRAYCRVMPARAGPGTGGGLAHKTQRKINVLDLDVSAVRVAEIERDVQRAWSAVHEHLKGGEG